MIDAFSRRIVGWSISDRITAEIVVDALEMARWRRRPAPGTVVHADRGAQYTSWLFGHRLRQAGLLGSMGRVASSVDNALIESFCPRAVNDSTISSIPSSRRCRLRTIFGSNEPSRSPGTSIYTTVLDLVPLRAFSLSEPWCFS
ncbi:hypothetical protein GCM10025863_18340 [Microbacterium suwonense]|uniref:Integrase catalytic domain-containing protein n=1 Tax=Microbacterium suwonense TaxID=683047 RepID=A0ABM8FUP5_9MICO|nr:hypothetical protein GCM10025863_18340 [Microbacterium suwonense]